MSDYGFKTVKTNKNGGKDTAINAKFPMMGFDMSHRPSAYVSFHISDVKTNPLADASNTPGYTAPSSTVSNLSNLNYGIYDPYDGSLHPLLGGANKTSGYVKELIYEYKHGYNFRPACYGTITGSLNLQTTTNAIGTPVAGNSYYNGNLNNSNWNLMTAFNTTTTEPQVFKDGSLFPYMNGMMSISSGGEALNAHHFEYGMLASDVPSASSNKEIVQNGIHSLTSAHFHNIIFGGEYPYSFEVDNECIRIYRTYYWSEVYGRLYFDQTFYYSDPLIGQSNIRYYIEDYVRARQVEQLYGSEIDINIMLFPYKMEDLK